MSKKRERAQDGEEETVQANKEWKGCEYVNYKVELLPFPVEQSETGEKQYIREPNYTNYKDVMLRCAQSRILLCRVHYRKYEGFTYDPKLQDLLDAFRGKVGFKDARREIVCSDDQHGILAGSLHNMFFRGPSGHHWEYFERCTHSKRPVKATEKQGISPVMIFFRILFHRDRMYDAIFGRRVPRPCALHSPEK